MNLKQMILKNVCVFILKCFLWILFMSTAPFTSGQVTEIEYECGAHGRFEYCMDGVPGCVIGCRCHPGHYFDADTSICEPNIKLTQNFRFGNRQFGYFAPTRLYGSPVTPNIIEQPTTTIRNAIDEKFVSITKDADDLEDWIYNDFFKTIESQVTNKTNEDILTRRNGDDLHIVSKPSKRSLKYWRARKNKTRTKKKGLRRKLLRITGDDSLFSSSRSEFGESSESSESSSSSGDMSPEVKLDKIGDRYEDGHGHKKIIVLNNRPEPPLPSFIFLPNMETSFYPPIGLPPPPMPLYPMAPVPPMMGSYPGAMPCYSTNGDVLSYCTSDNSKVESTSVNTTTSEHSTPTPNNKTNQTNEIEAAAPGPGDANQTNKEEEAAPGPGDANQTNEGEAAAPGPVIANQTNEGEAAAPGPGDANRSDTNAKTSENRELELTSRGAPQNKLMHKLREKIKRKNKLLNYFANEYQGPSPPFMDVDLPPNFIPNPVPEHHMHLPANQAEELRGLNDVDFNYLSQPIHRADLNKSNSSTPKNPLTNVATQSSPSRRSNNDSYPDITQLFYKLAQQPVSQDNKHQNQPGNINNVSNYEKYVPNQPPSLFPKKIEATSDTHYANLGGLIAIMIRNIDGDKEVEIEITNAVNPNSPV